MQSVLAPAAPRSPPICRVPATRCPRSRGGPHTITPRLPANTFPLWSAVLTPLSGRNKIYRGLFTPGCWLMNLHWWHKKFYENNKSHQSASEENTVLWKSRDQLTLMNTNVYLWSWERSNVFQCVLCSSQALYSKQIYGWPDGNIERKDHNGHNIVCSSTW